MVRVLPLSRLLPALSTQRRKRSTEALVAFIIVLAVALYVRPSTGHIRKLAEGSVVLAFGDSLTSAPGVADKDTYPAVLATLTGHRVINAGIPGETSDAGVKRLPGLLQLHKPALVILCHGGNDLLQHGKEETIAANIRAMAVMSKEEGSDVVIVAVPSPGILLSPPGFYETVAKSLSLPIENDVLRRVLSNGALKTDYVHPNEKGCRIIAQSIAELIRKSER